MTTTNDNNRTDLDIAALTGAYLTRATLAGADLTDADLTEACLTHAALVRADLSEVEHRRITLQRYVQSLDNRPSYSSPTLVVFFVHSRTACPPKKEGLAFVSFGLHSETYDDK